MSLKYEGIKDVFTKLRKESFGIWFSGIIREGEYKEWYSNGKLGVHCFYKNKKKEGEYKKWWADGELWEHSLYKNGKKIRDIK